MVGVADRGYAVVIPLPVVSGAADPGTSRGNPASAAFGHSWNTEGIPPQPVQTWFYFRSHDNAVFERELAKLGPERRAAMEVMMEKHRDGAAPPQALSKLTGGIWELKVKYDGEELRVLFAPLGGFLHALCAFSKKSQQVPRKQLNRARTRLKSLERAQRKR